jgi:hypothetical protein
MRRPWAELFGNRCRTRKRFDDWFGWVNVAQPVNTPNDKEETIKKIKIVIDENLFECKFGARSVRVKRAASAVCACSL